MRPTDYTEVYQGESGERMLYKETQELKKIQKWERTQCNQETKGSLDWQKQIFRKKKKLDKLVNYVKEARNYLKYNTESLKDLEGDITY